MITMHITPKKAQVATKFFGYVIITMQHIIPDIAC